MPGAASTDTSQHQNRSRTDMRGWAPGSALRTVTQGGVQGIEQTQGTDERLFQARPISLAQSAQCHGKEA